MARYKDDDFTLYPRKLSNSTVWYYYSYDDNGDRCPGKSTGIGFTREKDRVKTRKQADAYCRELHENKSLIRSGGATLGQWITEMAFWDWEKSKYVRYKLSRSEEGKPAITEGHCDKSASITENKIIPYHGNKFIDQISPYDCDQLLLQWQEDFPDHKNKTINNWMYTYSAMLEEYERIRKLKNKKDDYYNPWKVVKPLGTKKNKFGGLTIREVYELMKPDGVDFSNPNKVKYYIAMKTAFMTGTRISEVLGIMTDDIIDEYIKAKSGDTVRMSYIMMSEQFNASTHKRSLTKDKEGRPIPISAALRDELESLMTEPGKYLFSCRPDRSVPYSTRMLRDWFYKRLETQLGINEEKRKERKIVFHSTRRFFTTLLRQAQVADSIVQRFTGHDSEDMLDHYTDLLPEDLQEISRAQDRFLIGAGDDRS